LLAYAAETPKPPAALREAVLRGVSADRRPAEVMPLRRRLRSFALPAAGGLAVVAAAAALALGLWASSLSGRLRDERSARRGARTRRRGRCCSRHGVLRNVAARERRRRAPYRAAARPRRGRRRPRELLRRGAARPRLARPGRRARCALRPLRPRRVRPRAPD